MKDRENIVKELTRLIETSHAHVTFEDALTGLPKDLRTVTPEHLPYSIWQLVEHIRIAQADIIDFCESDDFEAMDWPKDYWPEAVSEVSEDQWNESLETIRIDRQRFFKLLKNEELDLFRPFSWGEGQNLFKEAVLIADHNAYHVAEIIVIRRLLGAWK